MSNRVCWSVIIGINLQFRNSENDYKIFTLGCIELTQSSTAENLKAEIELLMQKFNLNSKQVYCVTTDNGANYVKAVKLLRKSSNTAEDEDWQNDDLELEDDFSITEYEVDEADYESVEELLTNCVTLFNFFGKFFDFYNDSFYIIKIIHFNPFTFRYQMYGAHVPTSNQELDQKRFKILSRIGEGSSMCYKITYT